MESDNLMQIDLNGNQLSGKFPDIEFDCPFCEKHLSLKQDKKSVWHRPWMFHIIYDHKNLVNFMLKNFKDDLSLLLWHFAVFDDEDWLVKIRIIKKEFERRSID